MTQMHVSSYYAEDSRIWICNTSQIVCRNDYATPNIPQRTINILNLTASNVEAQTYHLFRVTALCPFQYSRYSALE